MKLKPGLRIIAIIPVRLHSTRLPQKALITINGKPLIAHTLDNAKTMLQSGVFNHLYLASDSEKIATIAENADVPTILTESSLPSGSARIAKALKSIPQTHEAEVVVNIQGDEPRINKHAILQLIQKYTQAEKSRSEVSNNSLSKRSNAEPAWFSQLAELSTLATPASENEKFAPQCVKVVCNSHGNALYFSRSCIPHTSIAHTNHTGNATNHSSTKATEVLKHIGVYAYRRHFIENIFPKLPLGSLESAENLEQLRVLESGYTINVCKTTFRNLDINVLDDVETFSKYLETEEKNDTI